MLNECFREIHSQRGGEFLFFFETIKVAGIYKRRGLLFAEIYRVRINSLNESSSLNLADSVVYRKT